MVQVGSSASVRLGRTLPTSAASPHIHFLTMAGSNGVFTAFPDKMQRHWRTFAVAFLAVSTFLYVIIPEDSSDALFDVSGGGPCRGCTGF